MARAAATSRAARAWALYRSQCSSAAANRIVPYIRTSPRSPGSEAVHSWKTPSRLYHRPAYGGLCPPRGSPPWVLPTTPAGVLGLLLLADFCCPHPNHFHFHSVARLPVKMGGMRATEIRSEEQTSGLPSRS